MMVFKKYDDQQVYQVPSKSTSGISLKVGDMFAQLPSTKAVEKITKKADAETAIKAGKELYIVAQGDDITKGEGLAYKTYKIGETVTAGANKEIVIVAYKVTMIDNVEGWEA